MDLLLVLLVERTKMNGRCAEDAMRLIQAEVGTKAAQIHPVPEARGDCGAVPAAATSDCSDSGCLER